MKKLAIFIVITFVVIVLSVVFGSKKVNNISQSPAEVFGGLTGVEISMKISSPAFVNAAKIPSKYTCDGADIIPPLEFSGVPSVAKSLAIIMDDPDSPSGDFLHWLIWNIPASAGGIKEGEAPVGTLEGKTGFGKIGYGGPCPGKGEHRYFFRLFALGEMLNLPAGSSRAGLESAMAGHVLEQAELYGVYKKVGN